MLHPLERHLEVFLQDHNMNSVSVAVSGGKDSMALLATFVAVRNKSILLKKTPIKLVVLFVHHGLSTSEPTNEFRNKAYECVLHYCLKYDIELRSHRPAICSLKQSELELRNLRWGWLKAMSGEQVVATAHHKQDLFETRFLRLLRGTGGQGLVAMQSYENGVVRPFLEKDSDEIYKYLKLASIPYVEDPSNLSAEYLRNWLRIDLFPSIEKRMPGSLEAFARSLSNVSETFGEESEQLSQSCMDNKGVLRPELLCLNKNLKRQVLALYMRRQKIRNYGLSHIDEIIKRLDDSQKVQTFKLLKKRWHMDLGHLWCEDEN